VNPGGARARWTGTLFVLALAVSPSPTAVVAQERGVEQAREAWLRGDYGTAETALRALTRRADRSPEALRLHARVLLEQGRDEQVLTLTDGEPAAVTGWIRGEALFALGRWDEASETFREAERAGGPDASLARLRVGEILLLRGRRAEAMAVFDGFIDLYNRGRSLSASDLLAVGRAVAHLGRATPVLFQDALKALDEAAAADPADLRVHIALGDLFLSRYDSPEAHEAFGSVLARNPRHPDALLGRARALDFDGTSGALEAAEAALETNPNHTRARAFLAGLYLKTEDGEHARGEAERALAYDARNPDALSVLAAAHRLEGDDAGWRRVRDRALALNPAHAELFVTAAELAVDYRKYHQAVELAAEAVRRDSLSWEGWGLLGMNRLRIGEIEAGRADLERAFRGDPYNPWFKNSLDLLDTFSRYETVETPHFRLFLHGDEAAVLAPYLAQLAEDAYEALRARYGSEPPTPIRLEVFPRHADFSVRTLGLVGLGALGVSFGSTLVMDSPSARQVGEFNWASTFWHELAHAFHLGLTDHNVPRWFSEGLAVREQRVARPWWGHRVGPGFLQAYREGRMPPLTRLNEAFVRPEFPEQVILAYVQSSLVFDWIEERWGFGAVRDFLAGYRAGHDTETLAPRVLGLDPDELDRAFDDYLRARFASELRATARPDAAEATPVTGTADLRQAVRRRPGDFGARLTLGRALVREGAHAEAEEHLRAALDLFPDYGAADGPLRHLATIHRARGELREAAEALHRLGLLGESHHQVHLDEAELRRELGDEAGERTALERAVEIAPFQLDAHRRLAELADRAGVHDVAVRERRVILALDPPDRAEAHYQLARALHGAGEAAEARTQVLRALEIAPAYEAALDLLLELRARGGGP
jgi:cellulose synthase operon protein C